MNKNVHRWLTENEEWILVTELIDHLDKVEDVNRIVKSHALGYLTQEGEFYNRLIELPNFIKIKQVVRASYLFEHQ
ncbi:MAG: hypothetical protein JEZ08_24180 [Clostridiales bacterium]|nr:hypothetical protein [Clostridiales bacterium]